MAKNTKQIALIQNRFGKLNELPKELSLAELGFAHDTNQLFIGNSEHPTLKERLDSDTFPYGNVEILTEFSDLPNIIKYSPDMNGIKISYPITILGNVQNPIIKSGSSIFINDKEVKFDNGIDINDYDYLVIRYRWTDGKDLDTETGIINATGINDLNNLFVGWKTSINQGQGVSVPRNYNVSNSVIYWSGDNVGTATPETPQEENILISRNNLFNDEYYDDLPEEIKFQLLGTWFSTVGHDPVMIEINAYRGGVMSYDSSTYRFYNVGGERVIFNKPDGTTTDALYLEVNNLSETLKEYNTLGYVTINKKTGNTIISTIGSEEAGEGETILDLTSIINRINSANTGIQVKVVNDRIQLKTINEILTLEDGTDIDGVNTLEAIGFEENVYLADKPTKRTLQDVLDDRYSIKAFDVMGDGITNDLEGINKATEIIYNYSGSDKKELFFPADTYLINDFSIMILENTHFKGEGIDRTILKSTSSTAPLMMLYDDNLVAANNVNYCRIVKAPKNILIEDMTFDISKSSNSSIFFLNHSNNITFKNCKFVVSTYNDFIECNANSKLSNIKFINCIFEGKETPKGQIKFNGELDNLLITNCIFSNINNNVIILNGNDNFIQNGLIANNRFVNCGGITNNLINVNEKTKYISVVKTLVDEDFLLDDSSRVLNRWDGDLNYCDTPILENKNKFLKFNFYQDIYDYIQELYNKFGKKAFEVVSPEYNTEVTNYIKMIAGDDLNQDKLSISTTSQTGDVEFNMGQFGNLHLGKDSANIENWKENYPYNILDIVYFNNQMYRCVEEHTSNDEFDLTKWVLISDTSISKWQSAYQYNVNDFVIYQGIVYRCITEHTSDYAFIIDYWREIADGDKAIILYKSLDLNDNIIENKTGNDITIKLKDNAIVFDDSESQVPYKERIGNKDNALATVGFVNDTLNSNTRQRFDVESINERVAVEDSSDLLLFDFNSDRFGNTVYLKDVSLNVRQLFIPIGEQIQAIYPDVCEYIEYANKIPASGSNEYEIGDNIIIENPNTNEYEFYTCLVDHNTITTQSTEYENFTAELNQGYWEEISIPLHYEAYSSSNFDYVEWYKGDVVRFIRYDENNTTNGKIYFYICKKDHVASVLEDEESSLDADITNGCWDEVLIDATDIIQVFDNAGYEYTVENLSSESGDYVHLTRYIGGNVYVILPALRNVIKTVPDLRYVSIKLVDNLNRNVDKWLFDINDVNLIYRNTNGYTYPLWQPNTVYQNGDIARFNYSNFKCIAEDNNGDPISHTSGATHLDLHNSEVWKKLNEPGFDYRFNFERTLLERDGNGKFYDEDYQFVHNVADHKLYVCLYDEQGKSLEILDYDTSKLFEEKAWEPDTTYYKGDYVTYDSKLYIVRMTYTSDDFFETERTGWKLLSEINSKEWFVQTEYFTGQYISFENSVYQVEEDFVSSDSIEEDISKGYLKLVPSKYIQLGKTGDLLVSVNYTKENL